MDQAASAGSPDAVGRLPLHLNPSSFQAALEEMRRSGAGSIYPVALTTRQIKKLRLA
jgi:hypothetical protein